jgi:hypothetical protein
MKANVNDYITENMKGESTLLKPLPRVTCADGFSMSIQAGTGLYSEQQKTSKKYSKVEIGYPSTDEPLLYKYAESFYDPDADFKYTDTVYPYVPVGIINKVLRKHGGIVI